MSLDAIDTPSRRKERGAFFTPPALARFISEWALRSVGDRVLEPSCGDAVFLTSAADRLASLGQTPLTRQLVGHDIHADSLDEAHTELEARGYTADLFHGDFFDAEPSQSFDAAIGNPPYIRFQGFAGAGRARSLARAAEAGVNLSGLASSWAAFTVHASRFLKRGGRLGLVLPAELLSVNYASPVRDYLLRSFASIELVLFDELVFAGVQADVVVLLADGYGEAPSDHFKVYQAKNVESIPSRIGYKWSPPSNTSRWTDALLSVSAAPLLSQMSESGLFSSLHTWGVVSSGTVTGANKFFALTPAEVEQYGLDVKDFRRLLPSGYSLGAMNRFTKRDWSSAGVRAKTLLFYPRSPLSASAASFIAQGESLGIDTRYKCRVRKPWWRVPVTPVPDLFVSYMSGSTPRIVSNDARALHLNSIHGLRVDPELKELAQQALPLLSLSSCSLLSAEIEGRAYGGGVLKLEPREAARWLVPNPETVRAASLNSGRLIDTGNRLLRTGDLAGASEVADEIIASLATHGEPPIDAIAVRVARSELLHRRLRRGSATSSDEMIAG